MNSNDAMTCSEELTLNQNITEFYDQKFDCWPLTVTYIRIYYTLEQNTIVHVYV